DGAIDNDDGDFFRFDQRMQALDSPAANQCRRLDGADPDDLGSHDIEIDGKRQAAGFLQSCFGGTPGPSHHPTRLPQIGMNDKGPRAMTHPIAIQLPLRGNRAIHFVPLVPILYLVPPPMPARSTQPSSPSLPPSNSCNGPAGMMVEIACL